MKRFYLFVSLLVFSILISVNTYADITYTIKKGDSLYKIAKRFKISAQEIQKANNLHSDKLKPGTKIAIPSKDIEQSRKTVKEETPDKNKGRENSVKNSVSTQDAKTHTVKGDGLIKIQPEQKKDNNNYHTVKKGDTLSSISRKYSISINELKEFNNLKSTKLKLGQQLILKRTEPRTYTVRKGDNISKIARKFGIDVDKLKELNNLESDVLKPGQRLLLEAMVEQMEVKKNYTTIISQASMAEEMKTASESKELTDMSLQDRLILFARKMLNIPYRFGGNTFMGIDCSAYVQKVYGLLNVNLPRTAREQFRVGEPVEREALSMGDLVFFRTYASFPSHVGIYLGNNLFIHASSKDKKVTIDSLETPYYFRRFIGAKRLLFEGDEEKEEPKKEG